MSKNYMEQVARMLGVEMGERFKLRDNKFELRGEFCSCVSNNLYRLTEDSIRDESDAIYPMLITDILNGTKEIVKIPKRKHTGLEDVEESDSIFGLFGGVYSAQSNRSLKPSEFTDRGIRDNWMRYIAIKKRLAKAASELNAEPIDWNNNVQAKWSIYYNNDNSNLELCYGNTCPTDKIYFTSKEAAKKAIEIVGEKDLIWMLRDFQPFIGYLAEVTE